MNRQQPGREPGTLQGKTVLVTRPAGQAETLGRLIGAQGGSPVYVPVIAIENVLDVTPLQAVYTRLADFDLAIFVSANAVRKTFESVLAGRPWPAGLRTAVVGPATANALADHGVAVDVCPARQFNSESLLELDALNDVAGQRIVIFRGAGGRGRLADTLRQRGADVEYAEVYRRILPTDNSGRLGEVLETGDVDIVTVTSLEGLNNLFELAGAAGRNTLLSIPIVVVNEKMAEQVRALGGRPPLQADNATDTAIMAVLLSWAAGRGAVDF